MKSVLEITGLKKESVAKEVEALKVLLADFQIFYTNLRGFHWHIEDPQFFTLHEQFEKMYDEVAENIDEVAERLLQLDVYPENRYSENIKISEIKEVSMMKNDKEILKNIIETYRLLMAKEREIVELAGEAGDEVTVGLMDGLLESQEKTAWMLVAMTR